MLTRIRRYLLSCGLLLLPASFWNIALIEKLPPAFSSSGSWRDIPVTLAFAEDFLRTVVFILPFFMPLDLTTPSSRRALALYGVGSLVYFASWLVLVLLPTSHWANSVWGFAAPAYTPFLWLLGIALLGRRLYWGDFYRWWMYLVLVLSFLAAHVWHAVLAHARIQ